MKLLFVKFKKFYIFMMICTCGGAAICNSSAKNMAASNEGKSRATLALVGYNYTNRIIESYSVDGAAGGHILMSSPTSGGSGSVCCALISKSRKEKISVKVRWQVDGCTYLEKNSSGRLVPARHYFFKDAMIDLDPAYFSDPSYLETHFYPDGSIKLKITESLSIPDVKLSAERRNESAYPRCENDKKPS